ncbi:MAG: Zn-ribbon domain-containing OB-fold protein [Candidatus Rokubacteria bacterium]|nr:Zn-ribbon domain-containing OB-fold protein [Candidatus Rokubacteria bacterium]
MAGYTKSLPDITTESRPFWEGCSRHQFLVQRCRACGARQHYPRGVCGSCWNDDLEWQPGSGRGTVYTFTVTHRTQARGFKDEVPYVLAWVELEEGVQVLTNIVGCDPSRVAIGMPVQVTFEEAVPGLSIPRFKPAG